MRRAGLVLSILLFVVASPRAALAHALGISNGTYILANSANGARLSVEVRFARAELTAALASVAPGQPSDSTAAIAKLVVDRLHVTGDGRGCPGALDSVAPVEGDGIEAHAHFDCSPGPARVVVVVEYIDSLSPGHRQFAHLVGVESSDPLLHHGALTFELSPGSASPPKKPSSTVWATLPMGIEHILTGWDHLLFLLALVIVGGRLKSIVGVVTAFTLAHSLTLAVAVLGWWAPSPRFVEPAIALSIAIASVENFFIKSAEGRWRLTFPFGLLHGFGFATALREIGLPRERLPSALLLFNLGVEIGQLAVLAVVLPLIFWARRAPWFASTGVRAISAVVAVVGVVVFFMRVFLPA